MYKKLTILIAIFSFFTLFSTPVFASSTCTTDSDCLQSINDNSYNLLTKTEDIYTSLSLDKDNPITVITETSLQTKIDDFNTNMTETLQVFGIFCGLTLFASAFNLGLFLYKR